MTQARHATLPHPWDLQALVLRRLLTWRAELGEVLRRGDVATELKLREYRGALLGRAMDAQSASDAGDFPRYKDAAAALLDVLSDKAET